MPDELRKLVNVFQGLLRAQRTATNSNLEAAQIVRHSMAVKVKTRVIVDWNAGVTAHDVQYARHRGMFVPI
ncbi:Uncharacterized protein HZ326_4376 [Fusarium oxysporum f. sp. albedinis]|nr:Uncharacterized protein HZ326_4376 [Fusarium oxysporum f. sp. albedinis]